MSDPGRTAERARRDSMNYLFEYVPVEDRRGGTLLFRPGIRDLPPVSRVSGPSELRNEARQVIVHEPPDLIRLDLGVLMYEVVSKLVEVVPRDEGIGVPERPSHLRRGLREVKDPQLCCFPDLRGAHVEECLLPMGEVPLGGSRLPQHSIDRRPGPYFGGAHMGTASAST